MMSKIDNEVSFKTLGLIYQPKTMFTFRINLRAKIEPSGYRFRFQ